MRFLTLAQVANLLKCPLLFSSDLIQGYSVDTRLLKPKELFFALKGERVDGHAYIGEAKRKGAIAAVVSKEYQSECLDFPLLAVDDPLYALQEIARHVLLDCPTRIVAITGSVGKTSTKEWTKTLLATQYRVAASPGNSNSQIGMPLTILNQTTGEEDVLILEMGMTAPGHLRRLTQIAPPEVSVLTTVGLVHACNFDSIREIALTKAEILTHPQTRLGILHGDMPHLQDIYPVGACHKISFSILSPQADYYLELCSTPHQLHAHLEQRVIPLDPLSIPGTHNYQNLLASLAVARYFNIDWKEIKQVIPLLALPERRLQFIDYQNILFVNDTYNASELSVKSALLALPQPQGKGRKIAVLGSMLELGKFSFACHERVGEFALQYVEQLYCLGKECLPMYEVWKRACRPVQFFENRADLVACLKKELRPADVVLLKGSRSKELWKVLEEL